MLTMIMRSKTMIPTINDDNITAAAAAADYDNDDDDGNDDKESSIHRWTWRGVFPRTSACTRSNRETGCSFPMSFCRK